MSNVTDPLGLALELDAHNASPRGGRQAIGLQERVDGITQASLPLAAVVALARDDLQLRHRPRWEVVAVQHLQPVAHSPWLKLRVGHLNSKMPGGLRKDIWVPQPDLCFAWPQQWALTRVAALLYARQQGGHAQDCVMALPASMRQL